MEVHLCADKGPLIVGVGNLFLFRVQGFPFDILPGDVFIAEDPAFTAGAAIIEQGTPFVVTGDGAVRSIAIPASIGLPGARFLQVRFPVVYSQEGTAVLIVGVGTDVVGQDADIFRGVEPAAYDVSLVVVDGFFAPRFEMSRILFVYVAFILGVQGVGQINAGSRSDIAPGAEAIPAFVVAAPVEAIQKALPVKRVPLIGTAT